MRSAFRCIFAVWFLAVSALAADWETGPRPAWAEVLPLPVPTTPPTEKLEGGAFDLNIETQINIETGETYRQSSFLIVNETGIQRSSSLQISFDPTYEHLTIHEIKLIRDGQTIDKLDPSKVRMLDREENLESHMLDGNLTFYYPLEDVRTGDTISYSYTLKGFQPAFEGKLYMNSRLQWSYPVGHQLFRIVGNKDRKLKIQTIAGAEQPKLKNLAGDLAEWRWESFDIPALLPESNRPDWHCAFPVVRLTEMNSWEDVSKWASGLYDLDSPLGKTEQEAVATIASQHASETARIEATLKFVQDRVRYLGFEIGHGCYKPSPAETVLTKAYGDCKDKAQLLTRLLRAMGISASPALVNTSWGVAVADFPPSPIAFNHVICKVVDKNGKAYWLDPTLSTQTGPLDSRHAGAYGFGLVIAPETRALDPIPESTGTDLAEVTETFDIAGEQDPANLTVRSVFYGKRADSERSAFQESSVDRIGRNFRDFYAKTYPDIEQLEPVSFSDFPEENRVVIEEKYRIPNLWEKNKEGRAQATFYPKMIQNEFARPASVNRKTPFGIPHPRKTVQTLELRFKEPWTFAPSDDRAENDQFLFMHTGTRDQNTIRLRYEYASKSDHVLPEKVAAYRKTVEAITDKMGWTFTAKDKTQEAASTWRMNWFILIPLFFGVIAAVSLIVPLVFFRKIPPPLPNPADADLQGLGGWLVLVQIGLWGTLISQISNLFVSSWVFNAVSWEAFTIPGRELYHPTAALVFSLQLFVNILLLPIVMVVLVLFYKKRWIVPRIIIGFLISLMVFHTINQLLASGMPGVDSSFKEIAGAIIRGAIWIPYFLTSRRVRATFVRP